MYDFSRCDQYDNAEELKQNFNKYCNWCWGNGYGDCEDCKNILKSKIDELEREKNDEL